MKCPGLIAFQPPRLRPERTPKIVEGLPEAAQGVGLVAIRPESSSDPIAVDVAAAAHGEQSQQPESLAGSEMRQRLRTDANFHRAEQAQLQPGRRRRQGFGPGSAIRYSGFRPEGSRLQ